MNRPLVWVAGSFAIGIVCAAHLSIPIHVLLILSAVALLSSSIAYRLKWTYVVNPLLLLSICFAAGLYYTVRRPVVTDDALSRELQKRVGETVSLEGTVIETSLYNPNIERISFAAAVEKMEDDQGSHPTSGMAQVMWYSPNLDLRIGDRIRFEAEATPFPGHLNPGLTQFRDYLHRRGIHTALAVFGPGKVEKVGFARPGRLARLVETTRRKIHDTFRQTLPEKYAGFLSAMWLGEGTMVPWEVKKKFIESGIYHIVVVSGLQVAIVFSMIMIVLGVPAPIRKKRLVIAIALVAIYALVAAANPPVVRAAIMAIAFLSAGVLKREPDALSTLCLAGLAMLLWEPVLLFQKSFQLSFLAMTGVIAVAFPREARFGTLTVPSGPVQLPQPAAVLASPSRTPLLTRSLPRFARTIARVVAVTLFLLPASAQTFNIAPPAALPANLIMILLTGPLLSLAALTLLTGFFWIPLARIFSAANTILIWAMFRTVDFFSARSWGHFHVRSPSKLSILCFYVAMVLALFHRHIPLRKRVLIPIIVCLFLGSIIPYLFVIVPPEMEVVFLDVGQGDCIFVQLPEDGAILIDGGPRRMRGDVGEQIIAPFLWKRGIRTLEAVVLSHPHDDHMGGLPYVLENFHVRYLLTNGARSDNKTYAKLIEAAERRHVPIHVLAKGSGIEAGTKVRIRTLHPLPEQQKRENLDEEECSLVLQMTYGTVDFLFTGDITTGVERKLSKECDDIESEVLKVPHHGSAYSSCQEFVVAVNPQVAVVQVGRRNRFGHPAPEIIERYRSRGCTVFRTDLDGAVTVESDGTKFWCRTAAESVPHDLNAEKDFVELWNAL